MSIIQRENPLNLQYNICIVTEASSKLGIRIAKALLKANALVLGIDRKPPPNEVLNAALGTHFQFEKWTGNGDPKAIVQAAKDKFGLDRLDAFVNIGGGDSVRTLADEAAKGMKEQGKGCVVSVEEDLDAGKADDGILGLTRDLAGRYQDSGIRCNVILPQASGGGDTESAKAFGDARGHMTELSQSKEETSKGHEIGLLVGWLASQLGETVAGRIVRLDGSSSPL